MSRVKTSVVRRKRVKKVLKLAKGAWGKRSKVYRRAKETVQRALRYSTRDRKVKKRQFRRLWIARINAAVREEGLTYSRFISGLKKNNILIDRSVLQQLAVQRPWVIKSLVELVRREGKKGS